MTTIGKFIKQQDGRIRGDIETLTWHTAAYFEPITNKSGDNTPDYRVIAHRCDIGAAWSQTSKTGKAYLSVQIDDPSFSAPLNCSLIETESGYDLIW